MKCISRDAFIAWLKRIPIKDLSDGAGLCRIIMADDFERAIRALPSDMIYDAEPVVYGCWIPFHSDAAGDIQYCSICGTGFGAKTTYCPNCGKRMCNGIMRVPLTNRRHVLQEAFEKCSSWIANFVRWAKKCDSHRN